VTDALVCPNDGEATYVRGLVRADPARMAPGTLVAGRYRVERELGAGGFGTVFAATDLDTAGLVALKVLGAAPDPDDARLLRFLREARVTQRLSHPNTVRVLDFGQDDRGVVFLVMEHLRGETLKDVYFGRKAAGRPFTAAEAARIAIEILASLEEAHAAGLVHRDLKPDNVMLAEGAHGSIRVTVLDFGIARQMESTLTIASAVPCTPEFASPEQAQCSPADARSDLYTVGINLFLLVGGRLPFTSRIRGDILRKQAFEPAPALGSLGSFPPVFCEIVAKAMQKKAADRFATATEMKAALQAFVDDHGRGVPTDRAFAKAVPPAETNVDDTRVILPSVPPEGDQDPTAMLGREALLAATRSYSDQDATAHAPPADILDPETLVPGQPEGGLAATALTQKPSMDRTFPGTPQAFEAAEARGGVASLMGATPVVPTQLVVRATGTVEDPSVRNDAAGLTARNDAVDLSGRNDAIDPTLIRTDPEQGGDYVPWDDQSTAERSNPNVVTPNSPAPTRAPPMVMPQQTPYVVTPMGHPGWNPPPKRRWPLAVAVALASFAVGAVAAVLLMTGALPGSPTEPPPERTEAPPAATPGAVPGQRAPAPAEPARAASPAPSEPSAPSSADPAKRPTRKRVRRPKPDAAPPAKAAPKETSPSALDIEI